MVKYIIGALLGGLLTIIAELVLFWLLVFKK